TQAPATYDIVVTPFFLDCFHRAELKEHLSRWLAALRVGGILYHVDFQLPQSGWQRARAIPLLWTMHLFFGWQTGLTNRRLVELSPLIEECGLRKVTERSEGYGMITTQLWRREM